MEKGWVRTTALTGTVLLAGSLVPALAAHPRRNFDSGSFLASPSLHSGRLPVVPILFWSAGHNLRAIGILQVLIGGAGWGFLLLEAARLPSRAGRALALMAVLLVAGSTYVVQWYAAVMSDSVSISLLALVVALVARRLRAGGSLWPLVVVTGLWALTRPTNAYVLVIGSLLLAPPVLARHRSRVPHLACALGVAVVATFLAGQGQLWKQPFEHSLTERVLPDPAFRGWFEAHGMPVDPALESLSGPFYPATDTALNRSPALAPFRAWMDRSGKEVYLEFLARHLPWIAGHTFGRHEELAPRLISYYGGGVARPWYPSALKDLLLTHRQTELLTLVGLDLLGIGAVAAKRRRLTVATAVWGYLVLLGFATLAIDWAGDSWEVGRHSVDGTITVALAGIMLLASLGGAGASSPARCEEERPLRQAAGSCPPSDRVPS